MQISAPTACCCAITARPSRAGKMGIANDLPVAQVELAAHIVTINEKSLRELGVK
ncbi:hypothetical protein KCP75_18515 [Salmonella enterica subsp. enterica]|nr:hypothetical protein KCP75_18515 [Salmonella enterica subsp. enterica]